MTDERLPQAGSSECIVLLVDARAQLDVLNSSGWTPVTLPSLRHLTVSLQ
jgi:hypothetical protein